MISIKHLAGRSARIAAVVAFGVATVLPALVSTAEVYAAGQFTPRKITMSSQASGSVTADANGTAYAAGDGGNGSKATHTFNFTQATSGATIGSVAIQYCTTPFFSDTCTSPTGMDAANLTAGGTTATGFSGTQPALDTTTTANSGFFASGQACAGTGVLRQNCILLSRTAAATSGLAAFQIVAGNGSTGTSWVKNPTALGTFYVRITTFSDNAYTAANIIDQGVVAGSVNETIDITAKVQEKLNFSVGNTTSITVPGTGCAALTSGNTAVAIGDGNGVLDPLTAYTNHSYWRISTNAANGTLVQYSGDTLKTAGGTNSIAAMGTKASSSVGTAQFGLTIDSADSTTDGYSLSTLAPTTNYNSTTQYTFLTTSKASPVTLVDQGGSPGVITCETGSVKYLANIPPTQKAGVYKTSVAYIAVPTF